MTHKMIAREKQSEIEKQRETETETDRERQRVRQTQFTSHSLHSAPRFLFLCSHRPHYTDSCTFHSTHTCIHCSLLISTPLAPSEVMALSMIFSTICVLPLASSSLAAVIQMWRSVGMFSRALLRTRRAFSYVSSLASASHS